MKLRGRTIFDSFYEETGVTVEMQTVPWTEIDNQLVLSTQAGNPPDVSLVRYQNFARNVEAGALLPLDDFVARDFTDEQISTLPAVGKNAAIWTAINTVFQHLYYA